MEIKISILHVFLPKIIYRNADRILEVIKNQAIFSDEVSGILVVNLNPFMIIMQLLETTKLLKSKFPVLT